jgi:hypothetical protein
VKNPVKFVLDMLGEGLIGGKDTVDRLEALLGVSNSTCIMPK